MSVAVALRGALRAGRAPFRTDNSIGVCGQQSVDHLGPLLVEAYKGRPERLIEEFEKKAFECLHDGADVVIVGCMPYGAALSKIGYSEVAGTGVPVVTALPAMIKLAESMVDLRRSIGFVKSEAVNSPYRSAPVARGIGLPQVRRPGQAETAAYTPRHPEYAPSF